MTIEMLALRRVTNMVGVKTSQVFTDLKRWRHRVEMVIITPQ